MSAYDLNPKLFLKMMRVIYFSLWSGLTTFLIMVLYLNKSKYLFTPDLSETLIISVSVLACLILPGAYILTKLIFGKIDQNDLLENKLPKLRKGLIIRMMSCEGIGILGIVSLMLTSNLFFLIILLAAMFIMILYYPSPDKIGRELNLTQTEIEMFNI